MLGDHPSWHVHNRLRLREHSLSPDLPHLPAPNFVQPEIARGGYEPNQSNNAHKDFRSERSTFSFVGHAEVIATESLKSLCRNKTPRLLDLRYHHQA
ncbi:MAG: hypothetical protein DMF04_10005 [Verrucomicrobia bacterium]|nr:MAG: hypothetical protein DMF04_10005 [Verrucomicrobiota bacterium]